MAKAGAGGGIDPKGNSWLSIEKSSNSSPILHSFYDSSLVLLWRSAALCDRMAPASRVTPGSTEGFRGTQGTHTPWRGRGRRRWTKRNQPNARLCHLRHGALLRFRTLLDNPKLTGKAIMVVVVGSRAAWDHGPWQCSSPALAGY
jgi:hypothetical protein